MTHSEIIVALGDCAAVGKRFGLARNTISNWKVRGIPWRWRPQIKDLARRKRFALPSDFLTAEPQTSEETK